MVLRVLFLALFVLALSQASCIKGQVPKRLAVETKLGVVVVRDSGREVVAGPRALHEAIAGSSKARNLQMQGVSWTAIAEEFSRKHETRDRMRHLQSVDTSSPVLLLVETRAEFYSQLNGRYRWTVYVKLSLAKRDDLAATSSTSFSVPVMLDFDHEQHDDALAKASGPIAHRLGPAIDRFLPGLDLPTETVPPVTRNRGLESIYFVMVDRFSNGDPSNDGVVDTKDPQAFHGGDIAGITSKLDYIQGMGFRTVWLSPVFSMRDTKIGEHGAFHGYWTEDLREIEPRFGTAKELQLLSEEIDKRDMKLVMDMVLNHVGYETKFVNEHPEWFHERGDIKDWNDEVQLTTHDVHGLPDLAQENAEVYDYLLQSSLRWVQRLNLAGFRLDAVKHVNAGFWKKYTRALADSRTNFSMIGELYDGNPTAIDEGFRRQGFSHLFDFPLYYAMRDVFCNQQHMGRLASILSLDRIYQDPSQLITFADNHDLPRLWSACKSDNKRVLSLLTFLFTARGIPCINYGTENAMAGDSEPSNRADMEFGTNNPIRGHIQELLTLREEHPVFRTGIDVPLVVEATRYAYMRIGDNEAAIIAVNQAAAAWELTHPLNAGVLAVPPGEVRVAVFAITEAQRASLHKRAWPSTKSMVVHANAEIPATHKLRMVGGGRELGNWQPSDAPIGESLGNNRFRFEIAIPKGSTSAFKLVVDDGESLRWEERDNRYLIASVPNDQTSETTDIRFGEK